MTQSVDHYLLLGRVFDAKRYDCLDFAREVWAAEVGEDLKARLAGAFGPDRHIERRHLKAFQRLDGPSDPCLVLMEWPTRLPHIGIFLRGRVLHLARTGAQFEPLADVARDCSRLGFYR